MKKTLFLSLQGSYNKLELSLFKDNILLEEIKENNMKASSQIIPTIKKVLQQNSLEITDLDFICADQGPGAFTSLRVTISTINGISFSSKTPLIGIDGLQAISLEALNNFISKNKTKPKYVVPVLNAYNNEVYFSINKISYKENKIKLNSKMDQNSFGAYKNIEKLIEDIKNNCPEGDVLFTGNGLSLHEELISKELKNNALFYKLNVCSTKQIAKMALDKWKNQTGLSYKLCPLYLKSQKFAIKK